MKNKLKTTEELFTDVRFLNLSESESDRVWNAIVSGIESQPIISPWVLQAKYKKMIPLLIGALLFVSAGGTVAASDSSAPGDTLFPVDRAVEKVQLAFANKDAEVNLKTRFAEERLAEVQELIARNRARFAANFTATSTASTTPGQTASTTHATSTKATSTKATTTPGQKDANVALGINVAIAYLNDIYTDISASGNLEAAARIQAVIKQLETISNTSDVKVLLKKNGDFQLRLKGETASSTASTTGSVKINTSGNKDRIEVREDGERIRIEVKSDGVVKVKSKLNKDEDEDEDDDKGIRGNATSTLRINLR